MKPPHLHKNKYEGPPCRGQLGPRDTVCGKTKDSTETTDDWDRVKCVKCSSLRWVHKRESQRFAVCGKRAIGDRLTTDWDKTTCVKCLENQPNQSAV